jgi:protein-disulfide isomerase
MMKLSRRSLMLSAAALAASSMPAFAQDAPKVDLTDLLTAPAEGEMSLGVDTAKVTIIEYASASCPHCAAFANEQFGKLKTEYIDTGKVKFIFREFPHNDQAMAAFMVARCSPKEKYFPLMDVYFKTQQKWVPDAYNQLKDIAKQSGMTEVDFEACLKNEKVAKGIFDVRKKAEESYGVTGIPSFFINGVAYAGERKFEPMKEALDALLK